MEILLILAWRLYPLWPSVKAFCSIRSIPERCFQDFWITTETTASIQEIIFCYYIQEAYLPCLPIRMH